MSVFVTSTSATMLSTQLLQWDVHLYSSPRLSDTLVYHLTQFSSPILALEHFQTSTIKMVKTSSDLIGKILAWHPTLGTSLCDSLFNHTQGAI